MVSVAGTPRASATGRFRRRKLWVPGVWRRGPSSRSLDAMVGVWRGVVGAGASRGTLLGHNAIKTALKWLRVDEYGCERIDGDLMVGVAVLMDGGKTKGWFGGVSDGLGDGTRDGEMLVELLMHAHDIMYHVTIQSGADV